MQGRLALNRDQVGECRRLARFVAEHLQKNTDHHTTLAIEQAVLRTVGAAPTPSHPVIQSIAKKLGPQIMGWGVAGWLGRTMVARKLSPEKAALYLAKHGLGRREELNQVGWGEAQRAVREAMGSWQRALPKAANGRQRNGQFRMAVQLGRKSVVQDLSACREWRDKSDMVVIVVPPPPLLFTGVPVTRRTWFRRTGYDLHQLLQGISADMPVTIQGCGMPELAILAALRPQLRVGVDPVSRIRCDHVDPHKVFVEYAFMNRLSAKAGFLLHHDLSGWGTPEFLDLHIHQVLALQIVLEQWLMQAGGDPENRVLVWPSLTHGKTPQDGAAVLAMALLIRELFPQSQLWQRVSPEQPAWDAGFSSLVGFTGVMLSESSAALLPRVREWGNVVRPLSYEIQFSDHGHISRRMHTLLERCMKELTRLYRTGLTRVVVQDHGGLFAMGKSDAGSDTVIEKDRRYWNPLDEYLGR